MDTSILESLFNHLVLPPRLPGKEDNNIDFIEHALLDRLLDVSRTLRDLPNNKFRDQWDCVHFSLQTCKVVNAGGKLNKTPLLTEFRRLERKDILILHIAEQNAGLLIRRDYDAQGEIVIFEAFEASALSEKVLASGNALEWDFPGCAIAIPFPKFDNSSFQNELAAFLEQLSTESVKHFAAHTHKAGAYTFESRDTVDPCLITEMLMTLLEVHGRRIFPPLLRKRVRDDVCWTDGAEKPWRRCAFWLVLRVGIQRYLCTLLGGETGRAHYKFLICLVLARLMGDSLDHLSPDLLALLKAKLCRRLAKLEVDKGRASPTIGTLYEYMFTTLGPLFCRTTRNATERIEVAWIGFKNAIRRPIPPLPRRADPRELYLTLPNSGPYLEKVLADSPYRYGGPQSSTLHRQPVDHSALTAITKHLRAFADRYFSLSDLETGIERCSMTAPASPFGWEGRCIELAKKINKYLDAVAGAYDSNPEQSSLLLLTVMELWMSMDECATKFFSLLEDYNSGLPPEILDVLHLPRFQDMCRLQKIQTYLQDRHTKCKFSRMTIFDDPKKGCFAERYYNDSQDSFSLQELHQRVETAAELARRRKELEWQKLSAEYNSLARDIAESACLYITDELNPLIKIHDDRNCRKCFLQRKARRIRIQVHEHPLPADPVQAKAVVFELGCPKAFAAYRDATWRILGTLATPKQMASLEPRVLLRDYSELKAYTRVTKCSLSLASRTKSFLTTHYSSKGFPVSLNDVCLSNGLKLGYFDGLTKVWPARQRQKLTFSHHCQMVIPASSPFSSLQFSHNFAVDADGLSSNEVIASQTKCPSGLNVHEFMAYQALFSGKTRRWPSMLIELGSSNLNFSTEATALLFSQLALQAGPSCEGDYLRTVHQVFRDESFCRRLMEQLDRRLDGISSNWRETHCMEMLVTLILRLCSIASGTNIISEAVKLLEKAREITIKWIGLLRVEIHRATDAATSRRCHRYAFWAALLCRRTFAVHIEEDEIWQPAELHCFIECSITLQDSLDNDPTALPSSLRNALIRDLKMVHRMRFVLRQSLEANPDSLMSAINIVWPEHEGDPSRSSSELMFLPHPYEWWVQSTVATEQTMPQTIHYHLLEGYLLIDGQLLGKLPAEHRNSGILEQLFGNQSLLTYPSGLPSMTYRLAMCFNDHQIHLGFRNGKIFVRACVRGAILELVPSEIFSSSSGFDLPASLVENCVHWLDLNTGVMEIRQEPHIWKSKHSNWFLNFNTRLAQRRKSSLVDPQGALFRSIARILDRFELRYHLTVFQPERWLQVELRRLDLQFFVNERNLLQSWQLGSEIDPDQDAGTWYGLSSKIVLRDARSLHQRSIIVPMGPMSCRRNKFHVAVEVRNNGDYGRFAINGVLGRLDCPAEPRLLYSKALFHAFTSFVLPDPLTGRTGTEEALHCLKSGYCQPWMPLKPRFHEILAPIASLTPRRDYYPSDLKKMQTVIWDANLTTTIQHEGFRSIVEAICEKSEQLSLFSLQKTEFPSLGPGGDPHLSHRSYSRRRLYQRPNADSDDGRQATPDLSYDARDRFRVSQGRLNVFESASLIRAWSSEMPTTPNLAGILQNWPNIEGYDRLFDRALLSDLLAIQYPLEWGSLVNLCRTYGPEDKYRLMFLFAVMSFRNDVDMDVVRTLIAFSVLDDLKVLDPPKWPSYVQFRLNQVPHRDYLLQLIKPCCAPLDDGEWTALKFCLSSKQRRKLEAAELAHEQQTEDDCKALAQFLLDQWPCLEPTIEGFSRLVLVDIAQALEIIRPEWQRLFMNLQLSHHIQQVQHILNRHRTKERIEPPNIDIEDQEVLPSRQRGGVFPELSQLVRKTGPIVARELHPIGEIRNTGKGYDNALAVLQNWDLSYSLQTPHHAKVTVSSVSREIQEVEGIIVCFSQTRSPVRQQYARDLMQSLDALKMVKSAPKHYGGLIDPERLSAEISNARQAIHKQFDQLCEAFERHDSRAQWLQEGNLWPCLTPVTLLEQLRSTSASIFGKGMKESLISYAVAITSLQHLMRIAYQRHETQRLREEQETVGHNNWDPLEHPDWLLLEIDANILIRHDQVEVALATISPASRSNSVLQMNMGQGKTSCIIPIAAAVLADTGRLVRVVVPRPLLLQTAQLLHARLGGLLGREVRHVPFSRKTSTKPDSIKAFHKIHSEMLRSSGVMLALPEHILSFMLSGLQRLSDARISEASLMVKVQDWMRRVCRDILDESDFTLAVRTQLIYPSGSQKTVDGHPHRWETAEALLRLVESHLWNLHRDFPESIEIVERPQGGFPVVFLLRRDVEEALKARLVNDICSGRTAIVPTRDCTRSDCSAIKQYISDDKVRPRVAERIRQLFPDKPAAKRNIYLLRGLLVHRILLLTLKKRWNVQYGLHPCRDPIAVPFHAKGVPSEQAEWGHPDVAILFTCLASYYGGLNIAQLRQSLENVLKSDDPSSEYGRWTYSSRSLPDSLREWNAINVDDESQLTEIWQHLRYNVVVVDYFLNNFVFPKHAKQFHVKLQASGWDIPLFSPGNPPLTGQDTSRNVNRYSRALTTGFSGTNDNRTMLPLTIRQEDLPGLSHTNAEVLTYLLQDRSRKYVPTADRWGKRLSEPDLLQTLGHMGIRILIDAGAQILEMDNLSLAKEWLRIDAKAEAAVFFNEENKPIVIYRKGHQIPLLASPFADNLDKCLVYLDEAHTRGTDLKMPADARGALTLGLGQTKDHTVQGLGVEAVTVDWN